MVKKLLKYEFSSFAKTILPMELILLCIAFFTRIVQIFEDGSTTFKVFMYSSAILLGIAMLTCIIMTIVVCVIRFYKNLYTAEGYLTLTLPVTHTQHIAAKLITSVLASLASLISVIIALAIATAGDVFHEIIKAAAYILKQAANVLKGHFWLYGLEIVAGVFLFVISVYLLLFACTTVGQMAKKNRVLAAFGVYFGYYVFRQILGTIFIIVLVNIEDTAFFNLIEVWMDTHVKTFFHLLFCFFILLFGGLSVAYFYITRHFMKNKLNIE